MTISHIVSTQIFLYHNNVVHAYYPMHKLKPRKTCHGIRGHESKVNNGVTRNTKAPARLVSCSMSTSLVIIYHHYYLSLRIILICLLLLFTVDITCNSMGPIATNS